MARAGEERKHIGHDRSEIVDLLRVATEDAFSDANEVVETAGELHGSNSGNHGSDDENHVPGHITRLHAKAKAEDENAGAADVANADAAKADTEEDRGENDHELEKGDEVHISFKNGGSRF